MVFECINIRQVNWEVLKTAAFGLGFQHLPRDLANVNAWKDMFDSYIAEVKSLISLCIRWICVRGTCSKVCFLRSNGSYHT